MGAQEDYFAREQLGSLGTLYGVYDGHGGKEASEFCSRHMGEYLIEQYRKHFSVEDVEKKRKDVYGIDASEYLTKGYSACDQAFCAEAQAAEVRSGTTAVACLLRGPSRDKLKLYTANCGDSRAVLCRSGKAVRPSDDHKPDRKDEHERILQAGGSVLQIGETWRCT